MNGSRFSALAALLVGAATAMAGGCAASFLALPTAEDISPKRRQRSEEAVRHFEQQRDSAEFEAAQARWLEGDVDGCVEGLERLLSRNPDHLEARLLMAELLLTEDRPQEAARWLEPALDSHAEDTRVQSTMGLAQEALGQSEGATVYYEQAAGSQDDDAVEATSYEALARANQTTEGAGGGLPPAPLPWQSAQRTGLNGATSGHNAVGREPALLNVPTGGVAARLEQAERLETGGNRPAAPTVSVRFIGAGQTADGAGPVGFADVDDLWDHAAEASAGNLLRRGSDALCDGEKEVALAYFQEAMSIHPTEPRVPISAASSALRYNQPEVAVTVLHQALGLFPDSAAVRRLLGTAYYRQGDYQAAQVAFEQALSLDNASGLSYFLMGCTLSKLGHLRAAEMHFRQAGMIDPRYAVRR